MNPFSCAETEKEDWPLYVLFRFSVYFCIAGVYGAYFAVPVYNVLRPALVCAVMLEDLLFLLVFN